jgi:hypothetical protein
MYTARESHNSVIRALDDNGLKVTLDAYVYNSMEQYSIFAWMVHKFAVKSSTKTILV